MSNKKATGNLAGKSLSDSVELFNDIFSEKPTAETSDTTEKKADGANALSKKRAKASVRQAVSASKVSKEKAKPSVGRPSTVRAVKSTSTAKKKLGPGRRPINKQVQRVVSSIDRESVVKEKQVKADKRIQTSSQTERETTRQKEEAIPLQAKPKRRLNPLVIIVSIVVFVALAGFFINYYGIVDLKQIIDSAIGSSKPVKNDKIRINIAKARKDKRVVKKLNRPPMAKKTGNGIKKIDDSLKTPHAQKGQNKRVVKKLRRPNRVKKTGTDKTKIDNSLKTPNTEKVQDKRVAKVLKTPSRAKETGTDKTKIDNSLKTPQSKKTTPAVKQEPSVSLHAGKNPDRKKSNPSEITLSYPYSIYLGSFQTLKGVHETVSRSRKIGLLPYWVKLDLGDKGTWFRIYAGYFRTREGADTFIKGKNIGGAQSRHTKYANFIGTYTSAAVLDKKQTSLLELGYSPYVISDKKDVFRLYVGAFYQKVRAEKQNADLASKGIQSQLVRR